jgi:CRP/FNR family transcriptional regulator, cyclic AMP receptor protein
MVRVDRSNHHRWRNVEQMDTEHGEGVGHIIADAEHEIFDGLNDADLADLDDRFAMATFRKGELIYSPFDRGEAMFLIESGRVRLFRSAADGRQVTLSMLDPGATFGQVSVLDEPMHDAYAEAMADSVVRILRVADLERTIDEHPRMALNLMRSLSERLRTAEDQIEALAFRPVPSRLAGKLLELMDRYGRVTPNGIRIDERFTHMQLAEMIGTSRETLTKVLNEMRDAGLIDVRERLIWVLDADGLERLKTSS